MKRREPSKKQHTYYVLLLLLWQVLEELKNDTIMLDNLELLQGILFILGKTEQVVAAKTGTKYLMTSVRGFFCNF